MSYLKKMRVAILLLGLTTTSLILSETNVYATNTADSIVEEATTNGEVLSGSEGISNTLNEELPIANVTAGAISVHYDALIRNEESTSNYIGANLYAGAIDAHREMLAVATDTVLVEDGVSNNDGVYGNILETDNEEAIITAIDHVQKYVSVGTLNVREQPDLDAEILTSLSINSEVTVIGVASNTQFVQIEYNGEIGFVADEFLSDDEIEVPVYKDPSSTFQFNSIIGCTTDYNGFRLTYYDLNMSKCISEMRSLGYTDEVWISSQGYKMMGNYIMAAGDYPKGTVLSCSLGNVIIVDHGTFSDTYGKMALDICTTWD